MTNTPILKQSREGEVAVLTIDHPPVNALNSQAMKELSERIDELSRDALVRGIVITGAGQIAFIAGADIKEIASISSAKDAESLALKGQSVLNKIESLDKPVIAAINAICLGGGTELAMACHFRIASERAKLGQPEVNLGIIPGFGGTQRLSRLVGLSKALELILTGDAITSQEAYRIGLVNRVVPDGEVLKHSIGFAKKIASKGGVAVRLAIRAVREGYEKPLREALMLEAELFGKVAETEDRHEGVRAFLEKRQPQFKHL